MRKKKKWNHLDKFGLDWIRDHEDSESIVCQKNLKLLGMVTFINEINQCEDIK